MTALLKRLDVIPESPGVYLMKDAAGSIIYVGKAVNLRNRLRSYFGPNPKGTKKVLAMIERIADFDFVLCANEREALVLESSLIKQYRPFYNILLKDDHDYPYIRITWQEAYPRLLKAYRVGPDAREGARYYGPFLNGSLNRALRSLHAIFPLKTCRRVFPRDIGKERPCLQYYIHRCIGPCLGTVTEEDYRAVIEQVCDFLEGNYSKLLNRLEDEMKQAAARRDYEQAAIVRDRLKALRDLVAQSQRVVSENDRDLDVLALAGNNQEVCVQKLEVRQGKITGTGTFFLDGREEEGGAVLFAFLQQHYSEIGRIPEEILLPAPADWPAEEEAGLVDYLRELRGKKVSLLTPQRGEKRRLLEMAANTAREALTRRMRLGGGTGEQELGLKTLTALCGLEQSPLRIEAYDISNSGADDMVCAMTVFVHGRPERRSYRSFHIRLQEDQDDYKAMAEAVGRRLDHWEEPEFGARPELILVDGGRGHVHTIQHLLEDRGVDVPVAGMVKDSKHRTRGLVTPEGVVVELVTAPSFLTGSAAAKDACGSETMEACGHAPLKEEERRALLRLLTAIQDETHRRAISANRSRSKKRQLKYKLETIPGVGPSRRKLLLQHFGSLQAISRAAREELEQTPGLPQATAQAVWEHFHGQETME